MHVTELEGPKKNFRVGIFLSRKGRVTGNIYNFFRPYKGICIDLMITCHLFPFAIFRL